MTTAGKEPRHLSSDHSRYKRRKQRPSIAEAAVEQP
jgi:hypothetical protein